MDSHFQNLIGTPNTKTLQNQPTSTADSATEDMAGDADEPPDLGLAKKATYPVGKKHSLLTQFLHSSESESNDDEDNIRHLSDTHRTQSSASTYSRGSATSMADLTSDGGHTSPRTSTPSPPLPHLKFAGIPPVFNKMPFDSISTRSPEVHVAPKAQMPEPESEKKFEAGLGRKRCIMFACPSKTATLQSSTDTSKTPTPKPTPAPQKPSEPTKRSCTIKFACPTLKEDSVPLVKPRIRLASPPPARRIQDDTKVQKKLHRDSDVTVKPVSPDSPRAHRKALATALRVRRESGASDMSRPEATRFHEFASSDEEVDDWTKESTCFQRRLTIDDTLEKEINLRKLGREAEEEDEDEDEEDEDENEELADEEDDEEEFQPSVAPVFESDDGFQTDDEHGFAHSDDDDAGSDNDWWTPGRPANNDQFEHIRPGARLYRSDSESSTGSVRPIGVAIPGPYKVRGRRSKGMDVDKHAPELPDSTDFVCGTLDEDKPMEQAYFNHLQQRHASKRPVIPQDIDPTFPTSDPEIDDEEDEVSEHDEAIESDHPIFLHGHMELHDESEDETRPIPRLIPKKRSPLGSPKRLRSPPPAKRISLHRSPPPVHFKRARSPAPFAKDRLSSSVPRNQPYKTAGRFLVNYTNGNMITEEDDNTPRFNRGAIDIVMGLEMKRQRRREKMFERHCRQKAKEQKAKQHKPHKPLARGKGAEKMRDLGLGLNAYRGKKAATITEPVEGEVDSVHMLSY